MNDDTSTVPVTMASRLYGILNAEWKRLKHAITRVPLVILATLSVTPAIAATDCNQSTAQLYEAKAPAVVRITALTINPYSNEDRIQLSTGSGFIIDAHGLILTNSHVVFGAQVLNVTLDDGTTLPVKLLGTDPIYDLAVLQIPEPNRESFRYWNSGIQMLFAREIKSLRLEIRWGLARQSLAVLSVPLIASFPTVLVCSLSP